ncbi:hypothetical protein F0562_022032 [Nyssa sinensis]|uniref:Uncharacterized protein n=1 Tax=Nyssa sinensis TaxID=561372 RepID=A0A5J5BRG8_9ASTE|nr:hypothetical protein F0562_022032 [Nyssa sinensis]
MSNGWFAYPKQGASLGLTSISLSSSDVHFVDVLFSLLTRPLGTVIKLTRNQPPTGEIGCMNNLYSSIENLDVQCLCTDACKTMLLHPQNEAETQCRSLKLRIDDGEPIRYFMCSSGHYDRCRFVSNYNTAPCSVCGPLMSHKKGISLLNRLKIPFSDIEERVVHVGKEEALRLLVASFTSKSALTDAFIPWEPTALTDAFIPREPTALPDAFILREPKQEY